MSKTYSELITLPTFRERFEYLKMGGAVGRETFGHARYLNQILYKCPEWIPVRRAAILRDNACDLACPDREIPGRVLVHHIEPITKTDILERSPKLFDLENLITVSHLTHEAIHYGSFDILPDDPIIRAPNDTCPWK